MSKDEVIKRPRVCVDAELREEEVFSLNSGQAHYLKNVMRMEEGATVRLFNGRDGEWLGKLIFRSKKEVDVCLVEMLRPQKEKKKKICLAFSPIKKHRMDFLIEKAVELGVDSLCPVIMKRTDVRKIKVDRIELQIREAAEQCERLTLPTLLPLQTLSEFVEGFDSDSSILVCMERQALPHITEVAEVGGANISVLIGPEGGFDKDEQKMIIASEKTVCVSLGEGILRSETAALSALILVQN